MKKIVLVVLLMIIITSCVNKSDEHKNQKTTTDLEKKYDVYTRFNDVNKKNELKKKLIKGDKTAYIELEDIYGLSGNNEDFFYYSIHFANKYNDVDALHDAYCFMMYKKDPLSQNIANLYLLKSYQNGYDEKIDATERRKIIDSLKKEINFDFILKE